MGKVERRSDKRKRYNSAVDYSVNILRPKSPRMITITARAKGIDISKRGIGIITCYPVMPEHIVKLNSTNGKRLPKTARVRWKAKKGLWYRIGLEFIKN